MTTSLQRTSLGELGYTPLVATSLGELGSTTIPVAPVPRGGVSDMGDATLRLRNLRRRTQRNIKHMLLIAAAFTAIRQDEDGQIGRADKTDPPDDER